MNDWMVCLMDGQAVIVRTSNSVSKRYVTDRVFPSAKRAGHKSDIYYISEVNQTCGKQTAFNFSGPYSEIRPTKLTKNNSTRTN